MCLEFGTPVVKVVTTKSRSLFRGLGYICDNMHVKLLFSSPSFESCERFQRKKYFHMHVVTDPLPTPAPKQTTGLCCDNFHNWSPKL